MEGSHKQKTVIDIDTMQLQKKPQTSRYWLLFWITGNNQNCRCEKKRKQK